MDSLEQLAQMIAETIDRTRKSATGCIGIRPKHVVGKRYIVYATAVVYILNTLAHANLVKKEKLSKGTKYLICKDSELYRMSKEEIAQKIIEIVEEYENKIIKNKNVRARAVTFHMPTLYFLILAEFVNKGLCRHVTECINQAISDFILKGHRILKTAEMLHSKQNPILKE